MQLYLITIHVCIMLHTLHLPHTHPHTHTHTHTHTHARTHARISSSFLNKRNIEGTNFKNCPSVTKTLNLLLPFILVVTTA